MVHTSVAPALVALIKSHAASLAATAQGAPVRGVFKSASAQRAREIVEDALAKGAKLAAGTFAVEGNLVQPLMLEGVTKEMREFSFPLTK